MPTSNVARYPPRVSGLIAPIIDIRLAPVTQRIEDRPVHVEQSITHPSVAREGVRLSPIVPWGSRVRKIRTGTIRIIP